MRRSAGAAGRGARGLGLVLAAALAGCAQGATTSSTSAALGAGNCPDWGCLSNAASMGDRLPFHELDGCGKATNDAGIRLAGFRLAGADLAVHVQGDELIVIDPQTAARFSGSQLVGGILKLESTATGEHFDVAITDVGRTESWVAPFGRVPTYTFQYRIGKPPPYYPGPEDRDGFAPLCAGNHLDPESRRRQVDRQLALVFGRDRYDARRKTVTVTANECWFNIACAGSAVAKMHLLRHTDAGSDASHVTSVAQRQAMLKTITDDICGTGRSFTQDGEDVSYQDARGWHPLPTALGAMEAVWDQDGAMCLDEARRAKEEPGLRRLINLECAARWPGIGCAAPAGPPPCSAIGATPASWTSVPGTPYAISVNPP